MSTEPTSIEGSVTPPTSIDSENSRVRASSQANVTTGKRKATPQRDVLAIPVSTQSLHLAPGDVCLINIGVL
ncbi:hypothetical protein V6Z11_A08G185600 [Gossypium hirsutum]